MICVRVCLFVCERVCECVYVRLGYAYVCMYICEFVCICARVLILTCFRMSDKFQSRHCLTKIEAMYTVISVD